MTRLGTAASMAAGANASTDAWRAERRYFTYHEFRRHVMALDDATFARVRAFLLGGWEEATFDAKVSRSFVLSRDPSIARALFDARPQEPLRISGRLMVAVGDPAIAARVLEASSGGRSTSNASSRISTS